MAAVPPGAAATGRWTSRPYGSGPRALTLGAVTFASEECPTRLPIGAGEQGTVVLELQGGGRSVFGTGAQPDPVSWKGVFYGANVQGRVNTLRSYMVSFVEIPITYGAESYYGRVSSFKPSYAFNDCEYSITIVITRDNNGAFSNTTAPSVTSQVASAQAQATVAFAQISSSATPPASLTNALASLNVALAAAAPISSALSTTFGAALTSSDAALAEATAYAASIDQSDPNFVPAQTFVNSLQLISANLRASQQAQSIRVTGGSLYDVAAQQYGDVTRAFDLMAANGLSSPYLPTGTSTTLYLPPYKANS